MAKYYGKIGFSETKETVSGVWTEDIVERYYYGEVTRNTSKWLSSGNLNDNIDISNSISIVSDPYAVQHFSHIRYIEWMDTLWKVSNIEVQFPRLILTIGGVYNGETFRTPSDTD